MTFGRGGGEKENKKKNYEKISRIYCKRRQTA